MLVDDHNLILDGLKHLIDSSDSIKVLYTADSGEAALKILEENTVDVVTVDVTMPGMSGVTLTQKIKEKYSDLKVIALSMYSDPVIIAEMMKAGAKGYILKDSDSESLIIAIESVMKGGYYFSEGSGRVFLEDYFKAREAVKKPKSELLTARELEILQLFMDGKKVHEIEKILHISRNTVNTHRANIIAKLGCDSFVDLIRYCLKEGICSPNL